VAYRERVGVSAPMLSERAGVPVHAYPSAQLALAHHWCSECSGTEVNARIILDVTRSENMCEFGSACSSFHAASGNMCHVVLSLWRSYCRVLQR
jgi:hypothetical protein